MSPWLATNAAASSRAASTILSSVKDEDTSELASDVAPTAPTTASVVTTKLVALAVPVSASNAARLKVFITFISTLLKMAQQTGWVQCRPRFYGLVARLLSARTAWPTPPHAGPR